MIDKLSECNDRNHAGMDELMMGARLPNPDFGQDVAFLAFVIGGLESLVDQLQEENNTLRKAIEKHRDANEHNQCWENDEELYNTLQEGKIEKKLPARCDFRRKCREYYESRKDAEIKDDGW